MKLKLIAATAAMLMTTSAQAAIITFTTPVAVPNNFDGIYINLLTGATGLTGASVPGYDFNPYNSGTSLSFFWNGTPASSSGGVAGTATGPYLNLTSGSVVSSASTFSTVTATAAAAAFQTTGTHILGFRFFNEVTNAVNYGYMTMTNTAPSGFPLTITGWSFENTGAAITVPGASAVPEPATWGLMILGFGMIGAAARSRKVKTTVSFA